MQTGLMQSDQILNLFDDLQYTNTSPIIESVKELGFPKDKLANNEVCFYRIEQLSYEEDYPRREAFENVLLSMIKRRLRYGMNLFRGMKDVS
jgi:hypothetical protein